MPILQTSNLAVLGIGFLLGLKHATDPDHIVAVTTFIGKERRLARGCAIGLLWGLGHTLALSIIGVAVVGLKFPMSSWLAERLELVVAVMLIVLGTRLVATVHSQWHEHHQDFVWTHLGLRPLLVGIVHGTAGSAALTLLVLSTIPSTLHALLYIVIFGIGSLIGMLAVSILIAVPLELARERISGATRGIQLSAGIFSCLFGLYLGISILLRL